MSVHPDRRPTLSAKLQHVGWVLFAVAFSLLVLGGGIAKVVRPWIKQVQFADVLPYLIPIWATGLLGLLCLYFSWVLDPFRDPVLRDDQRKIVHCRRSLRWLISGTVLMMMFASLGLVFMPDPSPLSLRVGAAYLVNCWGGFLLFLFFGYREARHPAVTSYLNTFPFPIALAIVPLTWMLLTYFEIRGFR